MDWRSFTVAGERPIHHGVVEGLRTYWVDRGGEFRAVLVFRVGVADEPLPLRGICHLIEHLAIEPKQRLYTYNGWSSIDATGFWAEGGRDEVLGYLTGVAGLLRSLPIDRLEPEKRILTTESRNQSGSIASALLTARCGARTYGSASFEEFGLYRLDAEQVTDWASRHFVAENAVLYMTGPPPDGFVLDLPHGESRGLPATRSIARLDLPTCVTIGQGGVGVGLLVPRGPATGLALASLVSAATKRLRHELGLSYHVWSHYQLVGSDEAHLTVAADCLDTNGGQVVSALLEVVDEMAARGPDADDLAYETERFTRSMTTPEEAMEWIATGELIGATVDQLREQIELMRGVQAADVAATVRQGAAQMIMLVPGDQRPPARFRAYPDFSERAVQGRMVRPKGLMPRIAARKAGLVLGDEGLSAVYTEDRVTTITWDECEALLVWPNGTVALIGCDGDRIGVPVEVFGSGGSKRVHDEAIRHVPRERLIPM